MKKISLLLVFIIGTVFILSGCGKEVVDGTDDLRCDGLYKTTAKTDGQYNYLRFYKEGKVNITSDGEEVDEEEVYEKINTPSNPNQLNQKVFTSNTFKVNNNVIIESEINGVNKKFKAPDVEYTYQTNMGVNSCSINIVGDKLKMKMVTSSGTTINRVYEFEDVD